MQTRDAYNSWAKTYDSVINKTRDLESTAIHAVLGESFFDQILELGCGTGKNTEWLAGKCSSLTALDFSLEMISVAQEKISAGNVHFRQADITVSWNMSKVNLITCSLVLEHVENINFTFQQAAETLLPGGEFYICELHPFRQLKGSRAKFDTEGELMQLEYFIHHVSDFFAAGKENGFSCESLREWFDTEDRSQPPRLVSFLFRKS